MVTGATRDLKAKIQHTRQSLPPAYLFRVSLHIKTRGGRALFHSFLIKLCNFSLHETRAFAGRLMPHT